MGDLEDLEELKLSFKRKLPPPRGSRGGLLCPVSPGILEREFVIWSDRPLFLWQANTRQTKLQKLELLQAGTLDYNAEILWEKSLSPASQNVEYDGQALQPGQNYQWQLTWNQQNQNQQWRSYKLNRQFRVMAAPERNQIAADLQTLATQLRARKVSDEAIAIRQAKYFVDRGLLSDAFQVLYMIKNPSTETATAVQELIDSVCKLVKNLSQD
ncbi:MAG: hypothetical protein HC866_06625 [Leptolyngbyaceae cyanobacterium RU_5_1]|nr:hypothetical protein [Leptolyngbyaceae cyanobacterium RU_5_1]